MIMKNMSYQTSEEPKNWGKALKRMAHNRGSTDAENYKKQI